MDIIVTTPKRRMAEAAREAEEIKGAGGGIYYRFFKYPRVPQIEPGDRIYYCEAGYIRGFCVVSEIAEERYALQVVMDATTWSWVKPFPYNGPRSWMYAERNLLTRDAVEVIGGWLDPKPEVNT